MTTPLIAWLPDTDAVIQYDMTSETLASQFLHDSSINSNNGSPHGSPSIVAGFQAGSQGRQLANAGAAEYVATTSGFASFSSGKLATMECLVKFTALPLANTAFLYWQDFSGAFNEIIFWAKPDGNLEADLNPNNAGNLVITTTTPLFPGAGYKHVRITVDLVAREFKLWAGDPGSVLTLVASGTPAAGQTLSNGSMSLHVSGYNAGVGGGTDAIANVRLSKSVRTDTFPVTGSGSGYKLLSAVPQSASVVRLSFDAALVHASSTGAHDALNPACYLFNGGLLAQSVAHVSGGTVFDVTLASETVAQSYTVQVIKARSLGGDLAIDAQGGNDSATFTGLANPPTCASASPGDGFVDATFSKAMDPSTVLASAFSVTGGSPYPVTVKSVLKLSATQWRIYTTRQHAGGSYALALAGTLRDTLGNALTPASVSFTGSALPLSWTASVLPDPLGQLATQVRVAFNQDMDPTSAGNALNYQMDKGATVKSAQVQSARVVILTTSPLQPNVSYQLTVS